MIEFTREQIDERAYVLLKNCDNVLDLGCGEGAFLKMFPNKDTVTGLDWNYDSIKQIKNEGYKVYRRDIRNLKLDMDKQSFDGVYCSHVIEHMVPEDAHKVMACMDFLVKPGGIIVIRTPMMNEHFYTDFSHIKPYPPNALRHYFLNTGKQRTFGPLHGTYTEEELIWRTGKSAYFIVFKKQ